MYEMDKRRLGRSRSIDLAWDVALDAIMAKMAVSRRTAIEYIRAALYRNDNTVDETKPEPDVRGRGN